MQNPSILKNQAPFTRSVILAGGQKPASSLAKSAPTSQSQASQSQDNRELDNISENDCSVLVINSSHEMAKEITIQLQLKIPGCSITYAPSIELSKWILKRKKVDLIVASPLLPDGSIYRLRDVLQKIESPPDLVVVGDMNVRDVELLKETNYKFATMRRFGRPPEPAPKKSSQIETTIKSLGADIRNDLNNPLQEIVAMVFVAQAGAKTGPSTGKALEAIDKAAKNMAQVVKDLEGKIMQAVKPHARG